MADFLQVSTTTDNEPLARQIADALVERRLAACVHIVGPIASVYRWQGAVERATEWLCTAKTRQENFDRLVDAVRELHTYEQPEIVATPIVAGSPGYLDWLDRASRD